jgi:hypothetical protein
VAKISVPGRMSDRDGRRFVLELDRRLEPLDRAILESEWALYTGRSSEGPERFQLARSALLSDPEILAWVRRALSRPWPILLRRRLELLERILLDAQVEQHPDVVRLRSQLTRRIVAFRPRWNGRKVNRAKIHRVLSDDPNPSNRRRAYYAFESFYRPLEAPVRRLIRLRNERAQALGFSTFAEMRLHFEGLTPSRLEHLAEAMTHAAPSRLRSFGDRFRSESDGQGWNPWDFGYARQKFAPLPDRSFPRGTILATVLRAVRKWGFNTRQMKFRVVLHDLPAGGLTLAPNPPRDVRILIHPQGGWAAYQVMFHEVGHAVHSASIRAPRHLLRWHENIPGFGGLHEGIGGLFEEIARNPAWLRSQPGISAEQANAFAQLREEYELLNAAWTVIWVRIEQALYRQPDGDPMSALNREARSLFGFDQIDRKSFVDPFWVDTPAYAPSYLLATLFHYQLVRTIREHLGDPLWPNSRVGAWLTREWFRPGSTYDWVPRIRAITGRPFSARDFQARFRSQDS